MKNFIQPGDTLTLPAPAAIASGEATLIGAIFGVASNDAASGVPVAFATRGVFTLPKVAVDNVTLGAPLYWDATAKKVTIDDNTGANPKVGVAVAAAAASTTSVAVRLNGAF